MVLLKDLIRCDEYSKNSSLDIKSIEKIGKRKKIRLVYMEDFFYFKKDEMDKAVDDYFSEKFKSLESKSELIKGNRIEEKKNTKALDKILKFKLKIKNETDTVKKAEYQKTFDEINNVNDILEKIPGED